MEDDYVHVRFRVTRDEFFEAIDVNSRPPAWSRYATVGGFAFTFLVVSAFAIYNPGEHGENWAWPGALAIIALSIPPARRLHRDVQWKRFHSQQDESEFRADKEGFSFANEHSRTEYRWTTLRGVRETPHLFLLYFAPENYTFVPKSALTPEALSRMREILDRRFGRTRGFPVVVPAEQVSDPTRSTPQTPPT